MSELSRSAEKFVLHWGEMGTRWGINRTVAQIHALLYLSSRPLNAEQIAQTLSVARSNVSTSLRELQSWGLVKLVHVLGDRRDHFESMKDVWEMFRVILAERKRREIDPTLEMLRTGVVEAEGEAETDPFVQERLRHMLEFFETMTSLYDEYREMPPGSVRKLARLPGGLKRFLGKILPG